MNLRIKSNKIEKYFPTLNLSPLVQSILKTRGLSETEIENLLNSQNLEFEDPFLIFGMEKAVEVVEEAIKNNQKIVIHGDFDVDGISATAILWDYLFYEKKADCTPLIPHRADEGYGLSEKTLQKTIELNEQKENKTEKPLLITVDCGIKDVKLVEEYKDRIDFVITDHHQFATNDAGEITLPGAKAVVHSAHPESKFPTMISGAATAWQLIRAIESRTNLDKNLVNKYLDLVSLSTVCDIIPLTLENRKFIQQGIKQIANKNRVGLNKLMEITGIDANSINCYHFGFVLGPRINAASRVSNDAMDALRLLSTKSPLQAEKLAQRLHELNSQRQALTTHYLDLAEKQIDPKKNVIVIFGEEWPEGILGLVAGKLAEKHFKPTFVASADKEGKITGSSRSPLDKFYLNKALEYAKDHLIRSGGHKQAAGFGSDIKIFKGFEDKVLEFINMNTTQEDFLPTIEIDLEIDSLDEIDIKDIEELNLLEPFGMGNTKPLFILRNTKVRNYNKVGRESNHLQLQLKSGDRDLKGIAFNLGKEYENLYIDQNIDVICSLAIDEWNGNKKIQAEIKHILYTE